MFHKLGQFPEMLDFLAIMPACCFSAGHLSHSVNKRLPCVTRASRDIAATLKRPVQHRPQEPGAFGQTRKP
jgi:hypothetical protein